MKNNLFKKSISALTAVAVCASMSSFSVFAEENIISNEESSVSSVPMTPEEAKQFVDSYAYNDLYKQMAQYIVDHADEVTPDIGVVDLALAEDLMDKFIKGEKLFGNSGNTSSNKLSKVDSYYYNDNYDVKVSDNPHYGVIISQATDLADENIIFTLNGITRYSDIALNEFKVHSPYVSGVSNNYKEHSGIWDFDISVKLMNATEKCEMQPIFSFPIIVGKSAKSELNIYRQINFDCNRSDINGIYTFETYVLGDVNHDGQVDEDDTTMLTNILAGLDTFGHIYKNGAAFQSEITNKLASDVNFDGIVNIEDLKLIKASIDGTYKLGDPVPENPTVTTTTTTKIDKTNVPMTPEEAKQFVDSYAYNDLYKEAAKYIVDHADEVDGVLDLELATDLMDKFIKGEKLLGTGHNGSSDKLSKVDSNYYNDNYDIKVSDNPHYGVVISYNNVEEENAEFKIEGCTSYAYISSENEFKIYSPSICNISSNFIDRKGFWDYYISIPKIEESEEADRNKSQVLFSFPIEIKGYSHSEEDIYRSLSFSAVDPLDVNRIYKFETYVLGDVNHDGQVNETDTTMLMNILAGSDTFGHIYKEGVAFQSEITNKLASDVNFDGTVDIEDLKLIKASIDGTYKLGDPVPESPITTTITTTSVTTTTTTTKIDKPSVPMTPEEAKQFVDSYSYNDLYKEVAQYIVDHADEVDGVLDLELATDLMNKFIEGEKLVGTSTTTTKPVITTTTTIENSISSVNPVEAKKFVDSYAYNRLYKEVAQYIVNNWDNLDEAKDMMDKFIEGEKLFISEGGTVNNDALETEGLELVKTYFDTNPYIKDTTIYGDVNGDESVSLVDVILLNKSISGSYMIPENLKLSADVYVDGKIDFIDTVELLKGMLGLVKLPVIPE